MIDLLKEQQITHNDTLRLGYKIHKQATIKKLLEEIQEFRMADKTPCPFKVREIINIKDNKKFVERYEKELKNKEGCELSDIIKVCLSYSEHIGTNSEDNIMAKDRYNKLRKNNS